MKESRDSASWTGRPYPLPHEPAVYSQDHESFGHASFGQPSFGQPSYGHPTFGSDATSGGFAGDRRRRAPADPLPYPAYPHSAPYPAQAYGSGGHPPYPAPVSPHGHLYPRADRSPATRMMQARDLLHGLGAVLSLALIVGAGTWVWQMMQRDVSGVPVVRALEGPLRVSPENPGGLQAAHQGLAINELAAAQESAGLRDLVLAPVAADLSDEDTAPIRAPESPNRIATPEVTEPVLAALQREITPDAAAPQPPSSIPLGFNYATRRAPATSPRPPQRTETRVAMGRAPESAPAQQGNTSGDALAASVANSVARGLSNLPSSDIDPATIGPGTRLVQLGAYDDTATARAAWDQLARRFSPLLDDRGRVIEAAHSGGSVFYRLRAHGFEDERDARRFCAALVDQQIDCIPVLIR